MTQQAPSVVRASVPENTALQPNVRMWQEDARVTVSGDARVTVSSAFANRISSSVTSDPVPKARDICVILPSSAGQASCTTHAGAMAKVSSETRDTSSSQQRVQQGGVKARFVRQKVDQRWWSSQGKKRGIALLETTLSNITADQSAVRPTQAQLWRSEQLQP